MTKNESAPAWCEVFWPRPLDPEQADWLLRRLATTSRITPVVFETVAENGRVRYLVGSVPAAVASFVNMLTSQVEQTVVRAVVGVREPVMSAAAVRFCDNRLPLDVDASLNVSRSILAALAATRLDETLGVQLVLWRGLLPRIANGGQTEASGDWWMDKLREIVGLKPVVREASRALESGLANKASQYSFVATLRVGVTATTSARREQLALNLLGALGTAVTAGVWLGWRHVPVRDVSHPFAKPWFWPTRDESILSVNEIPPLLGLPLAKNDEDLPGLPPVHPRLLPPPTDFANGLIVGSATVPSFANREHPTFLKLTSEALLHHLAVTGPTGVGKSALLEHLILQHVRDGRGTVVIEPKGDLVRALLAKIPATRENDVVLLDPTAKQVIGLNPLSGDARPELKADAILHVFTDLFASDIGPRSTDILHSSLLTLARSRNTSLVQIPQLLSDARFRETLVATVQDDPILAGFWAAWDAMTHAQQNSVAAPLMNKLRYILLRSSIRRILGQINPRFDVNDVFAKNRILLVPLPVASLGSEGAALLGSLLVANLWTAAQTRTLLPLNRRPPVMVCLDEFQNYARLPDIEDALATSRSLGVGWVLAHQFLDQLPTVTKAAVATNVRSRVAFQLAAGDAEAFAKTTTGHTALTAADFMALPPFHVYASLFANGQAQPFASGRTLPPDDVIRNPDVLAEYSSQKYGQQIDDLTNQTNQDEDNPLLAPPREVGTQPAHIQEGNSRHSPRPKTGGSGLNSFRETGASSGESVGQRRREPPASGRLSARPSDRIESDPPATAADPHKSTNASSPSSGNEPGHETDTGGRP